MKKFAKSQIYFHFFFYFFRCLFYLNLTVPPYAHNCCYYRIVGTKWCGVVWHGMPFDTTWRAATGITDRREYCSKQWRWQRNFPKSNSIIKTLKQTHKIRKFFPQIIIKFFLGFFDIQYFFITKQSVLWSTKMFVNNSIATTDQEATHTYTHIGGLLLKVASIISSATFVLAKAITRDQRSLTEVSGFFSFFLLNKWKCLPKFRQMFRIV